MAPRKAANAFRYIAANVRRERLGRGLTQQQLAERADLDLSLLQRVERAATNPTVATVVSLANALDLEPHTLLMPASYEPPPPGRPRTK